MKNTPSEEDNHKISQGQISEGEVSEPVVASPDTDKPRKAWGSMGIIISALAFIVLFAGFYLGYTRLLTDENNLAAAVADMDNKVSQRQDDFGNLQKNLADAQLALHALQATVTTQEQMLNALHHTGAQNNWKVSEAQYLATLANDNLRLQDNVPLVISLLQNADEKLQDANDPNIVAIRKALATDIAALQAVPKVDLTGIYLRLLALNGEADKLPMPNRRPDVDQGEQISTGGKRVVWWKRGLRQSWEAIKQVVTIRYNKAGQVPFIPPEQQAYLYQNLHAMFEQALSAVVHKQPEIYRASLAQASEWIKQYFLTDAPATQSLLTGIAELRAADLAPKLPEMTASLQAFNEFFAQQATVGKAAEPASSKQ